MVTLQSIVNKLARTNRSPNDKSLHNVSICTSLVRQVIDEHWILT